MTELMSPAGYWPQLMTAIEAGADAVYFGLKHFSARAKVGFTTDELPNVMQTLHQRGVKGFVTFNTLVFDHELELAEKAIIEIAQAGVDAVIVQDVGMAGLIKQIAPDLDIHGSTQMSITSAQGAELAHSLGCSRVVLGRELSLTDIRKIAESTDVELEVFVHGALCVSYSGQCFSSEAWGGRSANRGKCAQACRLSYDLIVDGQTREMGADRYLLSPGDLYALEQVPELIEMGIACLKIEGRYKDSDYVALTTRAYREAIDLAQLQVENEISEKERMDLEQIYSRGLGAHFISGTNHQTVVQARAPRHRGVLVAAVSAVNSNSVEVKTLHEIERGDGLVFDAADWRSPGEPEEGGNVYEVHTGDANKDDELQTGIVKLEFGRGELDFSRIRVGDQVWRTRDPRLSKQLKHLTRPSRPARTVPVHFEVTANGGLPIEVTARLDSGPTANFVGEHPLAAAEKRPLDEGMLQEKLGRLGGTAFHLQSVKLLTDDAVFARTSELNQARRDIVEKLLLESGKAKPAVVQPTIQTKISQLKAQKNSDPSTASVDANGHQSPSLHVLVRSAEQLDAAIAASADFPLGSITLDYLELYGLRPSVEKIRDAGIRPRVASPRILKPSEQNVIRFLQSLKCDIVVRSGGLLHDLIQGSDANDEDVAADSTANDSTTKIPHEQNSNCNLIGDFSLNAANGISCAAYLEMGLSRITPTYDLNAQQVSDLTELIPAGKLEVITYSHLPVFHTEHCVFCRFLSDGTDNTNCGHPCEKHRVAVRDQQGREHPVMADVGCRNTVFGAEAQTDVQAISNWREKGIQHFRIEFVHQSPQQVQSITNAFSRFFRDEISAGELQSELQRHSPQQITSGSLFVPDDFKMLVQLS